MKDSKAKRDWMQVNTMMIGARLNRNQDADIFNYLEGKRQAAEIKKGLRLLIEQENASSAQPAEEK